MKLTEVSIHGFRSIENIKIAINGGRGHKVLVGKNESGKSNILKALALLTTGQAGFKGKNKKILPQDKHAVIFHFSNEPREIEACKSALQKKFIFPKHLEPKVIDNQTINQFIAKRASYILLLVTPTQYHWAQYGHPENIQVHGKWYKTNDNIPATIEGIRHRFAPGQFISDDTINELAVMQKKFLNQYLDSISIENIFHDVREVVKSKVAPNGYTFPVVSWKYGSKSHNIPSAVNLDGFSQSPKSCEPLKNMFLLAGYKEDKIQEQIQNAKNLGRNELKTLFDGISKKTNRYICKNWKENDHVKIELRPDGDDIVIGVKETASTFDFDQRSDGFRRFISFLLLLSVAVENDSKRYSATRPLILIDEPEAGLHPSAAKELRNKLIELGQNNLVIYATHSTSMIDTDNIENNLIVTKENENTKIEEAKEDGTSSAENVYQAIGHSIYGDLKKNNILLEGYTDKKIFNIFMQQPEWEKFGICFTGGLKNIKHVSSILDLANRHYIILSDADKATTAAKKHKESMRNLCGWFTYEDLGCSQITIEDFYEDDFFWGICNKEVKNEGGDFTFLRDANNNRMKHIKTILHKSKLDDDKISSICEHIKQHCAQNAGENDIKQKDMNHLLSELLKKLNQS